MLLSILPLSMTTDAFRHATWTISLHQQVKAVTKIIFLQHSFSCLKWRWSYVCWRHSDLAKESNRSHMILNYATFLCQHPLFLTVLPILGEHISLFWWMTSFFMICFNLCINICVISQICKLLLTLGSHDWSQSTCCLSQRVHIS